jgi:Ca-activated chloride channel family protein
MRPTIFGCLAIAFVVAIAACEADAPSEPQKPAVPEQAEEIGSPDDRFAELMVKPDKAAEVAETEQAAEVEEPAAEPASTAEGASSDPFEQIDRLEKVPKIAKMKAESVSVRKLGALQGSGGVGLSGQGRGGGGGMSSYGKAREPEPSPQTNTEGYTNHGVNQMTQTAKDAQSTFAIDVDTGAYTIARKKLQSGQTPPESGVRVEEFVNYFRYSYPDPDAGPFGVHLEAAPSPFVADDNRKMLRVGVQGKRVTKTARKPVHLTFLVDVSGSMSNPDKLGLAQKALEILTDNLHKGDSVALATYAGRVAKILDPTGLDNKGRIQAAIKSLRSGGSTAMNSGLELAYKLALSNHQKDHVNRVIVLSDGDANVGPSSHKQILKRIRHFVDEGVTLSTIGFGMGNYQDTLMEQLANKGNGNYYYIDTEKEARKVFGEQLDGTLQVIAKDVKIQVEFNKDAVKSYRLIGYENRDIADKDFRDDKVDAGEIGAGHAVTALYELVLTDKDVNKLGTVRVRHKEPQGAKAKEQAFTLTRGDLKDSIQDASKDFQFATAVVGFAEILRGSKYANNLSFDLIEEIAKGGTLAGQQDRQEFIDLVKKAKALKKG